MALGFLHGTKIRRHFVRLHNHLAQKDNTRAYDFPDHAHHTHNGVHLLQIAAVRTQFFPDIGNRVNPNDIHSLVCQIEEVVHHFIEHPGISVIQIPLVRIKCCHDIMPHFRQVSEVARRSCREYLRDGFFILLRDRRICIEEIAAHVFSVSLTRLLGPLMIFRGMVHNKIHTQTYAFLMAFFCQFSQIIHRAEFWFYPAEICYRIAAV